MDADRGQRLSLQLDARLPSELAIGAGTVLFVCGTCFHAEARIVSLVVLVDGAEQPLTAHGMPRLDLFRSLHPSLDVFDLGAVQQDPDSLEDPHLHSYRSGFWGLVTIGPEAGAHCDLALRARLEDGRVVTEPLGTVQRKELERAPALTPVPDGEGPLVTICMATYEPPMGLFRRQIESLRDQTHRRWVCVISDDCSSPERFRQIEAEIGDDPRFTLSRAPARLGFYRNFERALSLAPANTELVALADQDDRWYPEKLAVLIAELGGAQLVYSDARVIDEDGRVRSDSYWVTRRNNHTDLLSLLVANSVTGAASLLRFDLLEQALPFPPAQFAHFHDHWLGLVALARGRIGYVDRPLYDYVQHGNATLGHAAANRMVTLRSRLGSLRADPRERVRVWRLHYFVDAARLAQEARILDLRLGSEMRPRKARALRRFLRADRSWSALAGLWGRGARELLGRPETLGAEWMLAYAFTWRRLLRASARERPVRGLRLDAVPPPDLIMKPGAERGEPALVREIEAKVAPLSLSVSDAAPPRINLLIPTIDLAHFFGGYIGKFNFAARLAEGRRVRIVTVDPVGPLPADWRRQIERYEGLAGIFDRVEVAFGRESHGLEISRRDAFIATTWWTAHIARAALSGVERERFLYLIQEYEPFTFPMGTYAALAAESYAFPHTALFSTALLRDYFRHHGIGVFAPGGGGAECSAVFENAITAVAPPDVGELAARRSRRLLYYARPEAHASRNMFELGILALRRALGDGGLQGWELHGIGSVGGGRRTLSLGGGAELQLVPRADQRAYGELLRGHDLGLALMYTPHPSLVPIEMAAAGMLTVTNSFENKTAAAMRAISPNLIAAEPTVGALASALTRAASSAADGDARIRGAQVRWSRSWDESFSAELLDRVARMLER
ncbi:MAG TPA: glycosyltransferase [Solirubrobacteraceae bacterium]